MGNSVTSMTPDELTRRLIAAQTGARVGTIEGYQARTFKKWVEKLHVKLDELLRGKFDVYASLAGDMTESVYGDSLGGGQAYRGPYSVIRYDKGEWEIERMEAEHTQIEPNTPDKPGIYIRITVPSESFHLIENPDKYVDPTTEICSQYKWNARDNTSALVMCAKIKWDWLA